MKGANEVLRILSISLAVIAGIHGLIHLLGFVAYWPLAKIPELPYKTTLLGSRLDLGAVAMRAYSLLWLFAALGFVIAAIGLGLGWPFWPPLMLVTVLLSMVLCILDWGAAFRGALIDVVLLLVLGVVFGLRVQPVPFAAYNAPVTPVKTVPIPAGLPKPVERFYHLTYGDQVPVYHSAVVTGRGTVRFMGIIFPARMRFTHAVGQGYRHYFEATFYGFPVFKVNEHFLDGRARLVLPFGVVENDPKVDSAGNQGLWAETMMFPASYLTAPRLRWEAVDDTTARLRVPFGDGEQVFTVTFDAQTGSMTRVETMRYRDERAGVIRWWGEMIQGESQNGQTAPTYLEVTWEDEDTPWLNYQIEDTVFNTDVSKYIRQTGP